MRRAVVRQPIVIYLTMPMKTAARALTVALMSWLLIVSSVPACCWSVTHPSFDSVPSGSGHHAHAPSMTPAGEDHAQHEATAVAGRHVAHDQDGRASVPVQFTEPEEHCSPPVIVALTRSHISKTDYSVHGIGVTPVLRRLSAHVVPPAISVEYGAPPGESRPAFGSAFLSPLRI
jgi:hypothetical protein